MKTILRSFATYKEFIQFMEYPSCNQCIHFMEYIPDDTKNIPRSLSLCKNEHLSKCKKFDLPRTLILLMALLIFEYKIHDPFLSFRGKG